jgi:hypothetical protein
VKSLGARVTQHYIIGGYAHHRRLGRSLQLVASQVPRRVEIVASPPALLNLNQDRGGSFGTYYKVETGTVG